MILSGLAKRLGLREVDGDLRQVGFHAWYEGVLPLPPERFGDARLISIDGGGWAWLIPLDERAGRIITGKIAGKLKKRAHVSAEPLQSS